MSIDPENQELPYTDDGPTEDVDIEITEEDLGESLEDYEQQEEPEEEQPEAPEEVAEQEEPEEEEAPKRRRSPEKRISELARKAAEAEQRAQALEARLQKESQLREQSEQAMMTHYRNNLSVTAMDLKQKLSEARSMMDNEKIDDLQYQFTKTMNDLEAVTNWEREQQNKAARPAEQAAPAAAQQPQVTLEPRTVSWIQKNTWFQPQSTDFDPEMHEEATMYARRVERRFRAEGRDDEIGSVDYFTEIDRHLRREFPDAFAAQSTPSKRAPPMSRDSNAAPVQRTAPGQPPKKSTSIRLNVDERRMAHQMAQSGAYRNPNGSRMNDLEAEKYHAIYILKTKKGSKLMARSSRIGTTRAVETREAGLRKRPETHFQSKLYVPKDKIPSGMTYAWVRESTLNEPDPDNMTDRMIRGWQPVPAGRHPEMVPPPLPGYEGTEVMVIRRGGLMLCECATRDVEERNRERDLENIETLQDVAWTGQNDPNLPRFEDKGTGVAFERVTSFKD